MDHIDTDERLRRARETAAILGRQIAYLTPDGKLIDGDGKIVEKTPNLFIQRING
jgi:hypothetical protein